MSSKKVTIQDIATLTNVSKTTISRYLNGKYQYMSEDTKQRIANAIALTHYQPSNIARSLKSNRSMLIGLVVADIESPFSAAVIKSVCAAMQHTGHNLIAVNCDNKTENEEAYIRSLIGQQVDGLIVNATSSHNPYLIGLANDGLPIVLVDRTIADYNFDAAIIDCETPIDAFLAHLNEMGYGTPALITESPYAHISPRFMRQDYFLSRLTARGIINPSAYTYAVKSLNLDAMEHIIAQLLRQSKKEGKPPAIITTNGVLLMNVSRVIQRMGLCMPTEIGLCGYDEWGWVSEVGWAEMVNVGLTTAQPSIHMLGQKTAQLLMNRMHHPDAPKEKIIIPAPLVIRNSTKLKYSSSIKHRYC